MRFLYYVLAFLLTASSAQPSPPPQAKRNTEEPEKDHIRLPPLPVPLPDDLHPIERKPALSWSPDDEPEPDRRRRAMVFQPSFESNTEEDPEETAEETTDPATVKRNTKGYTSRNRVKRIARIPRPPFRWETDPEQPSEEQDETEKRDISEELHQNQPRPVIPIHRPKWDVDEDLEDTPNEDREQIPPRQILPPPGFFLPRKDSQVKRDNIENRKRKIPIEPILASLFNIGEGDPEDPEDSLKTKRRSDQEPGSERAKRDALLLFDHPPESPVGNGNIEAENGPTMKRDAITEPERERVKRIIPIPAWTPDDEPEPDRNNDIREPPKIKRDTDEDPEQAPKPHRPPGNDRYWYQEEEYERSRQEAANKTKKYIHDDSRYQDWKNRHKARGIANSDPEARDADSREHRKHKRSSTGWLIVHVENPEFKDTPASAELNKRIELLEQAPEEDSEPVPPFEPDGIELKRSSSNPDIADNSLPGVEHHKRIELPDSTHQYDSASVLPLEPDSMKPKRSLADNRDPASNPPLVAEHRKRIELLEKAPTEESIRRLITPTNTPPIRKRGVSRRGSASRHKARGVSNLHIRDEEPPNTRRKLTPNAGFTASYVIISEILSNLLQQVNTVPWSSSEAERAGFVRTTELYTYKSLDEMTRLIYQNVIREIENNFAPDGYTLNSIQSRYLVQYFKIMTEQFTRVFTAITSKVAEGLIFQPIPSIELAHFERLHYTFTRGGIALEKTLKPEVKKHIGPWNKHVVDLIKSLLDRVREANNFPVA